MARRRVPRHVRIFLASPGDVRPEREAVRGLLQRLERSPLLREDFTFEVVCWDDPDGPVPMLATLTPQEAVTRALPTPSECDLTVVIIAARMGTPLEERRPDGTAYLSGTEWEFEDARRAGRPVLLYRRTTPPDAPSTDPQDAARQQQNVERFFAQFTAPGGALRGGYSTYATVEDLTARLRTDIESLVPSLRPSDEAPPQDASFAARLQWRVARWHAVRLAMIVAPGLLITVVAWAAFAAFSRALAAHDAPASAYVARYALLIVGLVMPLAMAVLTWWWFAPARRG